MRHLKKNELNLILQSARIEPLDVKKVLAGWGMRDAAARWKGVLLVEVKSGRGPKGGRRGKNMFALVQVCCGCASVAWGAHPSSGWKNDITIGNNDLLEVSVPRAPSVPNSGVGDLTDRRAAVEATRMREQGSQPD